MADLRETDCKHVTEHLVDYIYQELDDDQRGRIEGHLQRCSGCASDVAAIESTRDIARQFPELEPPAAITDFLLREARKEVEVRRPGFWERVGAGLRVLVVHPAMTAAVALVLVLGISFYAYRQSPPPRRELASRPPSTELITPVEERAEIVDEERSPTFDKKKGKEIEAAQETTLKVAKAGRAAYDKEAPRPSVPLTRKRPPRRRYRRKAQAPRTKPVPRPNLASMDDLAEGSTEKKKKGLGLVGGKRSREAERWVERGDLAAKKGDCDKALLFYDRALMSRPKLQKVVGPVVLRCIQVLGREGEGRLLRARKRYPHLAGWLNRELSRQRVIRARAAEQQKQAAPAKPAPVQTPSQATPK